MSIHNKGGPLTHPWGLHPMNVAYNSGGEYEKGVCDAILLVYGVISRSADGRKAILDLGFEPLYEHVQRPGDSFRDD